MDSDARLSRRGFASVAVGLLAGCTGDDSAATESTSPPQDTGADTPSPAETSRPATTEPAALDLREANVVGVEFERQDGSVDFSVTLHHDDGAEDGYANWWQVERVDGTRLGRRDLTHPHSNQPFTRSATIDVPPDTACVVVRGHDQIHGYGGRAALVDLVSGRTRAEHQGAEPTVFTPSDCP